MTVLNTASDGYFNVLIVLYRAMAAFGMAYADQNERDHEAFMRAIASGRLEAQAGL